MDYGLIWLLIIAFIMIMYILLDGFTLGVGLLFPWIKNDDYRDIMVTTVLPVWDGNETWLVFGGAALYGAFPLAFSTLFPIWYLPIMLLIFGLLLRGIAFEFRLKAYKTRKVWDWSLFIGSLMAVVAQGLIIGSFVTGFDGYNLDQQVPNTQWFSWFGLFCSCALVVAYSLLGSARLIKKTTGTLQHYFYNISANLQVLLLISVIFVGFYNPSKFIDAGYWFNPQKSIVIWVFIIAICILFLVHSYAIYQKKEKLPFISLSAIFIISYLMLVSSRLPYLVPHKITFMDARADDGALIFMLIAAVVLIPLLLFYTSYAYKIFGGKTNEKIHY